MSKLDLDDHLRDALMEALREDWAQTLEPQGASETPKLSHRQRSRFQKMLKNPKEYCRRYFRAVKKSEEADAFATGREARVRKKYVLRLGMAAVLAAVLAGSALAYSLTGGEFLTQVFGVFGRELGLDGGVVNTEQLAHMGSAELGVILETDEMRFELLDAVSGGSMSMTALRVTCKGLDRVIEEDAEGNCKWQAMFSDVGGTMMSFDSPLSSMGSGMSYRYDAAYGPLKPDQFYLLLNTNSDEPVQAGTYTVVLHDLVKDGMDGQKEILRTGDWTLEIPLADGEKYARTVDTGGIYTLGAADYRLERVQYSPLSMNLFFTGVNAWKEGDRFTFDDYSITLKNGEVLEGEWFFCGISSGGSPDGPEKARVTLEFNAPLDVEQIASVQFNGNSAALTE